MGRVLIIDDSAFMRRLIRKALEVERHDVIAEAEDGLKAMFYAGLLQPDIVTLDLTMPVMDGMTTLKTIKSKLPDTKVIVISAMGQKQMITEAIHAGASGFVIKPFESTELLREVNNALREG